MAKILRRKNNKDIDWSTYAVGDKLFDNLRTLFIAKGEIDNDKWIDICKRDMQIKKAERSKKINDRRYRQ